eukprot:CAMPEP_0197049678 /NCGR_PEP_ID=MMETSP1384-20130603/24761_1 /TAXON_ID=29189 /ORGANISM="Ammonia sp." /LENGTH=546 /DNA_ID=CAMNT_0042481993 /DNA_START=30 /DNA_END=1670 /DNA_ORIENTATION=-
MRPSLQISEDTWWTIFGAILAIIGCIFQAIGFIIQKIAHNRLEVENSEKKKRMSQMSLERSQKENASYDADEDFFSGDDPNDITAALQQMNDLELGAIEMKSRASSKLDRADADCTAIKKKSPFQVHRIKLNALRGCKHSKKQQDDNRREDVLKYKPKTYVSSKLWLLGFFLNGVVGSLLNILALNYAPQSVVLPLSATTLVGNTILATKFLNEPFPLQDFFGVCLVILGSIGTIIVGPKEEHDGSAGEDDDGNGGDFTVSQLQSKWTDTTFLIFFVAISFIIALDLLLISILNGINKRKKEEMLFRGETQYHGQEIGDYTIVYMHGFFLVSYPLIAAFLASVNFIVLKSFVQIIRSSLSSKHSANHNFTFYLTYVYIGGIVLINFMLEKFRQKGLRAFGAIYVIPIYQVLVITLGTTMGAIYFKEMHNMTPLHSALFVLSVFVTCGGVIMLALSSNISKLLQRTNCQKYLLTSNESDRSESSDFVQATDDQQSTDEAHHHQKKHSIVAVHHVDASKSESRSSVHSVNSLHSVSSFAHSSAVDTVE